MSQRKASTKRQVRSQVGTKAAYRISLWLYPTDVRALAYLQKRMGLRTSVAVRMALWRLAKALGAPADRT